MHTRRPWLGHRLPVLCQRVIEHTLNARVQSSTNDRAGAPHPPATRHPPRFGPRLPPLITGPAPIWESLPFEIELYKIVANPRDIEMELLIEMKHYMEGREKRKTEKGEGPAAAESADFDRTLPDNGGAMVLYPNHGLTQLHSAFDDGDEHANFRQELVAVDPSLLVRPLWLLRQS